MGKVDRLERQYGSNARESVSARREGMKLLNGGGKSAAATMGRMRGKFPAAQELADIALDRIGPDPDQPRKTFDPDELAELASTIGTWGQLQAAKVWYEEARDLFVLVFGERRWRAARLAGESTLRCVVLPARPTDQVLRLERLIENAARSPVPPLEEAEAFRVAMKAEGWSARELALKLGLDHNKVSDRLALLSKLAPAVREAVEAGELDASTAREIARVGDPGTQEAIATRAQAEGISRDGVRAIVRKARQQAGLAPDEPGATDVPVSDRQTPATSPPPPDQAPPEAEAAAVSDGQTPEEAVPGGQGVVVESPNTRPAPEVVTGPPVAPGRTARIIGDPSGWFEHFTPSDEARRGVKLVDLLGGGSREFRPGGGVRVIVVLEEDAECDHYEGLLRAVRWADKHRDGVPFYGEEDGHV